jgi:membrane-associated phospholipid phosphatase
MSATLRASATIVGALLALISLAFAFRVPQAALLHAAMLVAFFIACVTRKPLVIVLAIVVILMTLYQSIAEPAFVMMCRSFDSTLASIDRALFFGRDPALVVERFASLRNIEFFSLVYGWFIPYLWLSIILGCFGRPAGERDAFILGLSITYTLAYLGYLFVPSRGPIEWYHFAAPLHGGPLHRLVLQSVASTGGNHGAFPSLHVAASAYLCLFDLKRNPLRGMTYLPMVVLITFSTILLRYHYAIDVITGLAIAACAHAIAQREVRA